MNIQPLNDRVVVKPIDDSKATQAGIVLPANVDKERAEKGEIIAVGPGKMLDNGQRSPLGVKVGDVVLFKKYSPDEVKVDNVEYLILSESDVLAIVIK